MKGHFLNIGLTIGVDTLTQKVGEKLLPETVANQLSEVLKKMVLVTDRNLVDEDTLVVELIRPLDSFSIGHLMRVLGQKSIPQLSDGKGQMHGSKEWGEFNPYYFIMNDGKRLSEKK